MSAFGGGETQFDNSDDSAFKGHVLRRHRFCTVICDYCCTL